MWGATQPDPGGELPMEGPTSTQELRDLKDQFDQQQLLIAQLKEMLRKSEQTAVMQEKVEEYANTLTRMNARVKNSKLKRETDVTDSTISIDTPSKGKMLLLRQQMEENKLKLAERGKVQKGIEETVTQLKAQLDDSQQLINQTSINLSLIDAKEENYSIHSSQEELYNFLVIKDRRLNDLNSKIQKLEASVLDLQENVKEKDSVIDARTKAITLMTESLSKKGKSTLDALDDTKEQMRKMQENFIHLEVQMNEKNQLLLAENERLDNLCKEQTEEIQHYRNESSPKKGKRGKKGQKSKSTDETTTEQLECEQHLVKIAQYEATISELSLTIEELKATQSTPTGIQHTENADISKLKKQVDENNKNMIKIKAQHKSKIKELNKTVEELRKSKDSAEFKKLQEENAKLTEQMSKLALSSDLAASEHVTDLEMKLIEHSELVESKNQTISTLEEQIHLYKAQVEQLEKFSRLENDQVVSEIRSIDFEEQFDKVQIEKSDLQQKYDEITAEKFALLETIDSLTKEKHEIAVKLDSYIQENIELIDKLEKLSSAKVSSAESIEIVEGLTQQEKFELEEYQKGLEVPENIKNSVENLESPGLNESVNQLTEETSDLLRKIELFTEERREVMEKMEALAAENVLLSMKICEVENNRDILAETYEQIQNEKEHLEIKLEQEKQKKKELEFSFAEKITNLQKENKILKENIEKGLKHSHDAETTKKVAIIPLGSADLQSDIDEYKALIEIQKQEIQELKLQLLSQQNISVAHANLQDEVAALQNRYEALLAENEALTKSVKKNSEIIHEKDMIEAELINARKQLEEFNNKLIENLEEIENYKSILEENKNELISSANIIGDLQNKVQAKQNEIKHYETEIERLNSVIGELSRRVSDIETETVQSFDNMETMELMSNQLQELKEMLNENIKQIEKYEVEIQSNTETVTQLNLQLKDLQNELLNVECDLQSKDAEIKKLVTEQDSKQSLIVKLQSELTGKDESFHKACEKLKEKCVALQNKIDENAGSLDKINLPKIQELESKNKEQLEKMKKIAAALKKKNFGYQEMEQKYNDLHNNYKLLNNDSLLKGQEIDKLKSENEHLQNLTNEAEVRVSSDCNDLNLEINHKNDLIKLLTDELDGLRYNSEANSNALHVKIQELELFNESQDAELHKYKEQVNRLEEGLSAVEERRLSLERQAIELGNQLQEKSNSYEEISQIEDILEQRLATLMAQDKKMERRLRESMIENQNLQENNKYLFEENEQLKLKLTHAIEKNADADKLQDMTNEVQRLNDVVSKTESDYKRHYAEVEKKLQDKTTEVENMEVELQGQLEQLNTERKNLMVQCEQLNDQIKEHLEIQELLRDSLEDAQSKLSQQQSDFEMHILKFQEVNNENNHNMTLIDQLNSQALSNVNEIEDLNKSLNEKYEKIEDFYQQNKNLQSSKKSLQEQYDVVCKQLKELQITNAKLLEQVSQLNTAEVRMDVVQKTTQDQPVSTFVWPEQTLDPFDAIVASHSNQPLLQPTQSAPKIFQYFESTQVAQHVEPKLFQNTESQTFQINESRIFHNTDTQTPEKTFHSVETITEQDLDTETLLNNESVSQKLSSMVLDAPLVEHSTKQELRNKIKALEFMLFNLEEEKADVLSQCQELTGQIAQLIYEKQVCSLQDTILSSEDCKELQQFEFSPVKDTRHGDEEEIIKPKQAYLCYKMESEPLSKQSNIVDVDTQIVSCDDAAVTHDDLQQLQCIEFDKYEQNKTSEETCEAKTAYLCYPVDTKAIDACVVTNQDAKISKENLQQLQNIEFTKCENPKTLVPQIGPVSETMEAKTAYLCFKSDDAFDENDDGWGCGSDEAKLEADYHHQQQVDHNITYISELNEKIQNLEMQCEKHREESKQAQIKSGKLLKKLKEYKGLHDKLETELRKSGEFAGLDDALQDEYKSQITQLEKRLKDINLDFDRERNEKNNLVKRLDVLQAANERMVELKEKQDVEMLTWQRQTRELAEKLEQFEWGSGDSDSPKHLQQQPDDRIVELTAIINELTKDNDDLQILLEEQRKMRIAAEKSKVEGIAEQEYLNMVTDKNHLKEELTMSSSEKKALQDQLNHFIKINSEVTDKLANVDKEKLALEDRITDQIKHISELTEEMENIKLQVKESSSTLQNNTIQDLHNANLQLLETKTTLELQVHKLNNEYEMQITSYQTQITEITHQLQLRANELLEVNKKLEEAVQEKSALAESIQLLNDEWSQRVDQRGFDIAESWKLHLETRETEFTQIEQGLKTELSELEEKCNALVNENNELRKNVDAEIRNEVDKISALQQQINDRQLCINDLSRIVQEKQVELELQQSKVTEYEVIVQNINEEKTILKSNVTGLEQKLHILTESQHELQKSNELLETLQSQLNEKQKFIDENLPKLNKTNKELEEYKETVALFQQQIESKDQYISELAREAHESLTQVNLLSQDLTIKIEAIKKLEAVIQYQSELKDATVELNNLKELFNRNEEEFEANVLERETLLTRKTQEVEALQDVELMYREALSEKDGELDDTKHELFEVTQKNNTLTNEYYKLEKTVNEIVIQLNAKIQECEELQRKLHEQEVLHNDESKQISELGVIIEDQVLKIEELKEDLYVKSKDYDSLIAELDIRKPASEHMPLPLELLKETQVPSSSSTQIKTNTPSNDDSFEPISRAELDLALYMLHQRDVRCEELTVELIQLLEERDTLQLKLSNSIREKEELRKKAFTSHSHVQPGDVDTTNTSDTPGMPSKVSAIVLGASGTEIATEALEASDERSSPLVNKLLELKTVSYRRDKTLLDEQDRRLQQLALMQEHRDLAALLPPEAAAKLVHDANYTLSRDVQSPSKVLLNWLWGNSTPKVNNV